MLAGIHDIAGKNILTNVETTSRDAGGNQDGSFARLEGSPVLVSFVSIYCGDPGLQCIFAFVLSTVRVDGSRGQSQIEKVIVHEVGGLLGSNEDQSAGWRHREKQVVQSFFLLVLINPQDLFTVSGI